MEVSARIDRVYRHPLQLSVPEIPTMVPPQLVMEVSARIDRVHRHPLQLSVPEIPTMVPPQLQLYWLKYSVSKDLL